MDGAIDRGDAQIDVLHRRDALELLLGHAQLVRQLGDAALEQIDRAQLVFVVQVRRALLLDRELADQVRDQIGVERSVGVEGDAARTQHRDQAGAEQARGAGLRRRRSERRRAERRDGRGLCELFVALHRLAIAIAQAPALGEELVQLGLDEAIAAAGFRHGQTFLGHADQRVEAELALVAIVRDADRERDAQASVLVRPQWDMQDERAPPTSATRRCC